MNSSFCPPVGTNFAICSFYLGLVLALRIFNEPRVVAALGYDDGIFAPGRCTNCTAGGNSATEPYIVAHNILLSHSTAVKVYREKYQKKQKGTIGILLDFVWYEPLTNSTEDEAAAKRSRDFHIGWFLEPLLYGSYPKSMQKIVGSRLPKFTPQQCSMVKGAIDFVGINQYTSYYASDNKLAKKDTSYQEDWTMSFHFERNGVPIGPRAHSTWLYIVPWGMYKAVTYIKDHYGNPLMILSENGMDQPGNISIGEGVRDTVRQRTLLLLQPPDPHYGRPLLCELQATGLNFMMFIFVELKIHCMIKQDAIISAAQAQA